MGAQFGTICYADLASAASAACAQTAGVTSAGAMSCTGVSADPSTGAPVLNLATTAPDGTVTTATAAMPDLSCDPLETYTDMAQLWGWGVLAAVSIWLMKNFVLRLVMPQ